MRTPLLKILLPVFLTVSARAADETLLKSSPENLRKHVQFLAEMQPPRSYENLESLNKVADYITAELKKAGLQPTEQTFEANKNQVYKNIIVSLGPKTGKRLVIGAHYDVCGHAPGADDNASGVAGLLEIARLLAENQSQLERPIEIVAYTLEEPPFFAGPQMGSYIHAKSLREQKAEVDLMIGLEMIGYFSDEKNSQDYPVGILKWLYPTTGNFISILGRFKEMPLIRKVAKSFKNASTLPLETLASPVKVPGMDLSDHANYWQFDYPAVMVTDTAFMRNPNYHQPTDTPDTLDYTRMAEVVNGIFAAARDF